MLAIYIIIFLVTLICGLGMLLARRADHAAFWLMGAMFGIAANFLLMSQELLAFVQVIVYVGAVMVLFLFVIMLLNLREPEKRIAESITATQVSAYFLVAFGLGMVMMSFSPDAEAIQATLDHNAARVEQGLSSPGDAGAPFSSDAVKQVAVALLTTWIYPFEIVSLLLLSAVVGAVIIARRRPLLMIDASAPAASSSPAPASSGAEPATPSPAFQTTASSPSGRFSRKSG